jgi:hypothetical protein
MAVVMFASLLQHSTRHGNPAAVLRQADKRYRADQPILHNTAQHATRRVTEAQSANRLPGIARCRSLPVARRSSTLR